MMNEYLTQNLLPLMLTIVPKMTESFILSALGMEDKLSQQSILIAVGERLEVFWNKVISDFAEKNLIEDEFLDQGVYKRNGKGFKKGDPRPKKKVKRNKVKVGNKNRQIDHFFRVIGKSFYMESKCNLNFDTEKIIASNEKVREVSTVLGADKGVYFVPVLDTIPQEIIELYAKEGIEIWGVSDLLSLIDAPFTTQDFFKSMREEIAPVLISKGL